MGSFGGMQRRSDQVRGRQIPRLLDGQGWRICGQAGLASNMAKLDQGGN